MSSSIPIPKRKSTATATASASTSSSPMSSSEGSMSSSPSFGSGSKGKGKVVDMAASSPRSLGEWELSRRRPSLLGSSLSQSSYTVINLSGDWGGEYGEYDGPTRLVSCIKSSQGFDWNLELFLPASYGFDYGEGEMGMREDVVVKEVFVSDEEAEGIWPRW